MARRQKASVYSFQPPVRGLVLNEPLVSASPGGARVLENFFPTSTSIRTRGGSRKYATIGTSPVERMWMFKSGNAEQIFASDATHIFELTSVSDPETPPSPVVSGRTSGAYSVAQFGTAGGNYLYAVNGADKALLYDGATWKAIDGASTPAITGVATTTLSFVWSFASRLFFIQKNTMNVWYLPVDAIGGAAAQFSLAGVFQEGGSLLIGGKWSLDAGNGLDDKCLFISTEGEVAVYQGTNPGSASDWSKVGVYRITAPLGPNAVMSAGGDFLVATKDGIVPISEAVNKDSAALSLAAVTKAIEPEWKKRVAERGATTWEILKRPTANMAIVSMPATGDGQDILCLVVNLQTGAWSTFTGWDIRSMVVADDLSYFGTRDGKIYRMEDGGTDDGAPYTCVMIGMPDQLKAIGAFKVVHSARGTFQSNIPFKPKISAATDYKLSLPSAPSAAENLNSSLWDAGIWDVSKWDAGETITVSTKWASIGKSGFAVSPQVQVTCGNISTPHVELIQFDVMYETGGVMV